MKKQRPRQKKRKPPPQPRQSPSQINQQKGLLRQLLVHWYGKLGAAIGALVAAFLAAWAIYQAADGIRQIHAQTIPEIHIVASSTERPFSLPFSVKNPSSWFDMRSVVWACRVITADIVGFASFANIETTVLSDPIKPGSPPVNYRCRFDFPPGMVRRATVSAEIKYQTLFFERPTVIAIFNWMNDRWIEGEIR